MLKKVKSLGGNIKSNRERLAMTQKGLAQKIGATQELVSSWETGRYDPNLESSIKLAEVFGLTLDALLVSFRDA